MFLIQTDLISYKMGPHMSQHTDPTSLQLPSCRAFLHPRMSFLSQTYLHKHSKTRANKHALTKAHAGDSVTSTHTMTICCVFIDMHEDTRANLFAHPRGAHMHSDACAHKLTCTYMVVNMRRRVTCARTHAELVACTGTFTHTQPTPLAPTLVFPWAGTWPGDPGSPECLPSPSAAVGKPGGNFQLQSCS